MPFWSFLGAMEADQRPRTKCSKVAKAEETVRRVECCWHSHVPAHPALTHQTAHPALNAVPPCPRVSRPVSAPGRPVQYLTAEQKAALNKKYGKIEPPTVEELTAVAESGCKMQ